MSLKYKMEDLSLDLKLSLLYSFGIRNQPLNVNTGFQILLKHRKIKSPHPPKNTFNKYL